MFHDFKRALIQRPIIVLLLIILILPVAGTYSTLAPYNLGNSSTSYFSSGFGIGTNGTYEISTMVYTGQGFPVRGSEVNLTVGYSIRHERTDASGYANFSLTGLNASEISYHNPGDRPRLSYSFSTPYGEINETLDLYNSASGPYFFSYSGFIPVNGGPVASLNSSVSRYRVTTLSKDGSLVNPGVNLFYEALPGINSSSVYLYYEPINSSALFGFPPKSSSLMENNMSYYGEYSGFTSVTVNPTNVSKTSLFYLFALFSPSGKILGYVMFTVQPPAEADFTTSTFFRNTTEIYELFIPLMSLLSAYYLFGKDRIEGVLESVLVRPLSKTSLMLTRYFSGAFSVIGASLISFALSSLVIYESYGKFLPESASLSILWTIVAEVLSFSGIMFLLPTFIKSQARLISAMVGIFLVADLFWSFRPIFPSLIMAAIPGISAGGITYFRDTIISYYLSPAGLSTISEGLNLGPYAIPGVPSITVQGITPAYLGLTTVNLIVTGLLWAVIPITIAVAKFKKWD